MFTHAVCISHDYVPLPYVAPKYSRFQNPEHEEECLEAQCVGADFLHTEALPSSCNPLGTRVQRR